MQDPTQFQGPMAVTVAYFLLWYSLLFGLQTRTKYRLKARYELDGKVFDRYFGQDPEMLAVDRAVANTHEQMGPFLASLWLFSFFASPTHATWLGAAYVALRGLYPFLLGNRVSKVQSKRVALVTFPCYAIVFTLLGGAAWAALGGRGGARAGQSPSGCSTSSLAHGEPTESCVPLATDCKRRVRHDEVTSRRPFARRASRDRFGRASL